MEFLSKVPTTWDATLPLDAEVGQFIVTARKKGNNWYVGAMTNHAARDITIDFSFLPDGGNYTVQVYHDNDKTATDAKAYTHDTLTVSRTTKQEFYLGAEGGLVLVLTK
ncbi:MAG: glycoside hydrolase family 97 C-terminal domain-containing protein [Bacteroidota bacterium]